jgi:hypothetical protein
MKPAEYPMATTVLSAISNTVLILGAAACLPRAVAHLVRACIPLATAIIELCAIVTNAMRANSGGTTRRTESHE